MSLDFQGIILLEMFSLFKFLTILFSCSAGTFGESIYGDKFPGENTRNLLFMLIPVARKTLWICEHRIGEFLHFMHNAN